MGKIMFLWNGDRGAADGQQGTADGAQWALGGDTWVVGCKIPDCAVMNEFNGLNPDRLDDRYNTGMLDSCIFGVMLFDNGATNIVL